MQSTPSAGSLYGDGVGGGEWGMGRWGVEGGGWGMGVMI